MFGYIVEKDALQSYVDHMQHIVIASEGKEIFQIWGHSAPFGEEMKMDTIEVRCKECGTVHKVANGHLTQEGIDNYVCEICREAVLERRVEDLENKKGGRKLLVEG